MPEGAFNPRSAFAARPLVSTAALSLTERDGLGVVHLCLRRGQRQALERAVADAYGIDVPSGPLRRSAGSLAMLGTGPEQWLLISEQPGADFVPALDARLNGLASTTDQSDGYAVVRLAGPAVRDTLARLVPIDVHPRAFRIGDVAATTLSHMSVLLWRLEDQADMAVVELAVFRSFAVSLSETLASHSL